MTDLTVEKCVEFLRGALERGEVEFYSETDGGWRKPDAIYLRGCRYPTKYRTKPRRVEGWVNVYPYTETRSWPHRSYLYPDESLAKANDQSGGMARQVYVCEPE